MSRDWKSIEVDRTFLSDDSFCENSRDREFWLQKPVCDRMSALELLRQVIYGYDSADARLQRILEVVDRI